MQIFKVFAAWNKNKSVRRTCASGGIFTSLATMVIKTGGAVVGAAYDNQFFVHHIVVEDLESLQKLKGSKYVQSNLNGVFPRIKKLLDSGRTVLFSGTPCQINALQGYLEQPYEGLLTCALLCYGTPERIVYKKYIEYLEEKAGSEISKINFKEKRYGWDYYTTRITFENGATECQFGGDSYSKLMKLGYSLCPACLDCVLDYGNTCADIYLGDFYTYSEYLGVRPPKSGINCVIIKSDQAFLLFNRLENVIKLEVNSGLFEAKERKQKREFDVEGRKSFLEFLKKQDYINACEQLGIRDEPLTARQKMLAFRLRLRGDR